LQKEIKSGKVYEIVLQQKQIQRIPITGSVEIIGRFMHSAVLMTHCVRVEDADSDAVITRIES